MQRVFETFVENLVASVDEQDLVRSVVDSGKGIRHALSLSEERKG